MTPSLISLKKVSIKFGTRHILSNIFLDLKPGRILTILGPNGAGKSTLVRVVLKLIIPHKGHCIHIKNLRIGYVPQKFNLDAHFPINVQRFISKNICVKKKFILSMLKKVQAEHLIDYAIQKLSGGEIQRVLLARALLQNPNILVLDEPTQGIDLNGQITFYNLIDQLRNELGCSILMVSHNIDLVMEKTDEILCLNNHICCAGTPKSILTHPVFSKIFSQKNIDTLSYKYHHHNLQEQSIQYSEKK